MQRIPREEATKYEFGPDMDPAITVEPGERFRVETWDARAGLMFESDRETWVGDAMPQLEGGPPAGRANPVAGPIYVEGATAGDVLAVHVEQIVPDEVGWTGLKDSVGVVHDRLGWDDLHEDYAQLVHHEPGPSGTTADGTAVVEIDGRRWEWDLNPHIGTIVTAPGRGRDLTVTSQGPWGGNLDVRHAATGSTIFLNAFNDGGQLFLGDVHGCQGDSELTVIADETPAEVTLSVDVLEDEAVPGTMRIETPDRLVQVDSARSAGTPQNALENCFRDMMAWLVEDHGFSQREAYLHMSINPAVECHIYQFIPDAGYVTCGVEFPTDRLDPGG